MRSVGRPPLRESRRTVTAIVKTGPIEADHGVRGPGRRGPHPAGKERHDHATSGTPIPGDLPEAIASDPRGGERSIHTVERVSSTHVPDLGPVCNHLETEPASIVRRRTTAVRVRTAPSLTGRHI